MSWLDHHEQWDQVHERAGPRRTDDLHAAVEKEIGEEARKDRCVGDRCDRGRDQPTRGARAGFNRREPRIQSEAVT